MAGHRILIVEDSPTMRQLLVFALKRMKDVDIVEAQDGMDGLRKVTSDHFDLAFVDINMPVMDGLKLISLIRGEQEPGSEMPICVITTEGAKRRPGTSVCPWRERVPDQADSSEPRCSPSQRVFLKDRLIGVLGRAQLGHADSVEVEV